MEVIELIQEMSNICDQLRRNGHKLRLVPTMGALHAGHGSLISRARDKQSDNSLHLKSSLSSIMGQRSPEEEWTEIGPDNWGCCSSLKSATLDGDYQEIPQDSSSSRSSLAIEQTNLRSSGDNAAKARIVVIVSIFVNQKQFNNSNDFLNYPKTLDADLELCRALKVDYVFLPSGKQMYPEAEIMTTVLPPDNQLCNDLEGKSRPGHFAGMLTVVCKLFNIIRPHEAYFGEKDYQQVLLVSRMVEDLNMKVRINPVETVREPDLLPLSSRNVRLGALPRQIAPVMCQLLLDAKQALELMDPSRLDAGCDLETTLLASMLTTLALDLDEDESRMIEVDYLALRCANDLSEISRDHSNGRFDCKRGCAVNSNKRWFRGRLLTAVMVDGVRLLDNIEVVLRDKQQLRF